MTNIVDFRAKKSQQAVKFRRKGFLLIQSLVSDLWKVFQKRIWEEKHSVSFFKTVPSGCTFFKNSISSAHLKSSCWNLWNYLLSLKFYRYFKAFSLGVFSDPNIPFCWVFLSWCQIVRKPFISIDGQEMHLE